MNYVQRLKRIVPRGLHPLLGAVRRRVRSAAALTSRQKRRLLEGQSLGEAERALLGAASSRIHHDDGMYKGDGAHYFGVGLSAIRCIEEALRAAGVEEVRKILDLPCGYGRVLRLLIQRFPRAEVTACEIDRAAADFCAREFGAKSLYSAPDLDALALDRKFDLIWCGSLVTHLDRTPMTALLRFFRRHLASGGLVVFTAHGDFVARRLPTKDFDYGLTDEQIRSITEGYARAQFAYTDYPDRESYGISLTSPEWMRARVREVGDLREVYFRERGWDDHQDVYGFVKED